MKCQSFREAYSARLDHEESGLEAAALDAHLTSCPGCRQWSLAAEQLTRQTRIMAAPLVPDLTAEILARHAPFRETVGGVRPPSVSWFRARRAHRAAQQARPAHQAAQQARPTHRAAQQAAQQARRTQQAGPTFPTGPTLPTGRTRQAGRAYQGVDQTGTARFGLVMVALAQLAIAIPALAGADSGASVHIAHEQGSWALALAVGLLVVVWSPARANGMLPLVGALVAGLTLTSGLDILNGRTAASAEAPHGLAILGLMLLWWVAHPTAGQRTRQA